MAGHGTNVESGPPGHERPGDPDVPQIRYHKSEHSSKFNEQGLLLEYYRAEAPEMAYLERQNTQLPQV